MRTQTEEVCIQDQIYLGPNQYGAGMIEPFHSGMRSPYTTVFDEFSSPLLASQKSDMIDVRN